MLFISHAQTKTIFLWYSRRGGINKQNNFVINAARICDLHSTSSYIYSHVENTSQDAENRNETRQESSRQKDFVRQASKSESADVFWPWHWLALTGVFAQNLQASKNFPPSTTSLCDNSNDSGLGFEESHHHHQTMALSTSSSNSPIYYRPLSALRWE